MEPNSGIGFRPVRSRQDRREADPTVPCIRHIRSKRHPTSRPEQRFSATKDDLLNKCSPVIMVKEEIWEDFRSPGA